MPRKGPIPRREVLPDPIYGSRLAARFVNRLMYDGKKGAAEKIFYGALEVLAEKTGEEALRAFEKALENVKPHLEVKARRVGGATYQVPMEVRPERQLTLALRWLVGNAFFALVHQAVDKPGSQTAVVNRIGQNFTLWN